MWLSVLIGLYILPLSCNIAAVESDSNPVSHDQWTDLLQRHVTDEGWVDYEGFMRDSAQLQEYLDLLRNHHPNEEHWSSDERLAYWINAYNAFTVELILDHYPVESIKDIKKGLPFINTVWDIKFITIEGEEYDLNNIEHGIIRERFDEPRIHFAVNCASRSCPKLMNEAYTADRIDEQLTQVAREFLREDFRNKFHTKNRASVSPLFKWYSGDFTENGTLVEYLNQYAPVELNKEAEIDYLDYDWTINDLEHNVE